jgi:hypothetical protein
LDKAQDSRPIHRRLAESIRKRWRAWLRSLHRDVGYFIVGLTFIYALSGLAINHIGQIDPNFKIVETKHRIAATLPRDDVDAAASAVLVQLGVGDEPRDYFFEEDDRLEIYFDRRTIIADLTAGTITDRREKPRFFLRVANWLHYNRGKAAWTYIADMYAVLLLFAATSGIFMLKGRKGLIGRGAVLILIGSLIPLLYVHYSGGPGG